MQVLLDTHVLIWLVEGSKNLSVGARDAIEDENNSLYLSIVSLWEITIKLSLSKLDLQLSVDEMVESFLIPGGIEILPIETRPWHYEVDNRIFSRLLLFVLTLVSHLYKVSRRAILNPKVFDQHGAYRK